MDHKLQWKEQIKKATQKGTSAYDSLSRLVTSTWGPTTRRSRLIYSAVVRPTMLYGSQVWGIRDGGEPATTALLQPLRTLQNKCLRRVARAYKRTPTAALERETATPPIDLHIDTLALQRSVRVADHPVTAEISRAADEV